MHELAIGERIVSTVTERLGEQPVRRVVVEVGRLSGVAPEALHFCFDLCAKDTPVEGAALEIRAVAGLGRCEECGAEQAIDTLYGSCRCGSPVLQILRGRELRVKEVELA